MAIPIPLILAAANAVPALMKFFGAGDTETKVAADVAKIATTIAGVSNPQEALKTISEDPEKRREFELRVMQHMQAWDKMYLEDTQNARARDVALRQSGDKNYRANILVAVTFVIVILCFCVVVWMSELNEYTKGIITLILGRALGWVEQIMSFEFGTTRSSKKKDATIESLSGNKNV